MDVRRIVLTYPIIVCPGYNLVSMGYKKIGRTAGGYNGYGGHVEPEEATEDAAVRELLEESGWDQNHLPLPKLKLRGSIRMKMPGTVMYQFNIYVGEVDKIPRLHETDEMVPETFWVEPFEYNSTMLSDYDPVPYHSMPIADRHWLPLILNGYTVTGEIGLTEDDKLFDMNLNVRLTT